MARLLGAIMAGGRATRFGSDKAAALLDGRRLIDHAIDALSLHVAAIAICGRIEEAYLSLPDRPGPDMGPLGGLNAALHHAQAHGFDGVLTSGCDMPFYPAELPALLIGERAAILDGQQLLGWWPAALAPELDAHLAEDNNRSIRGWLARIDARTVTLPGLVLPNINRPDDLAAIRRDRG
ncbi:molybdenum cofactor guanylyltransferase [Sphingobium sp. WW5]|uniref:molybdenum cofactor guanylyltransferase n=1 Tax=unclassified Sphingobium TaxID=2611147 RepID=UPI003C248824